MKEASGVGKVIIALAAIIIVTAFCGMAVLAFVIIKHLVGEIATWAAPGAVACPICLAGEMA